MPNSHIRELTDDEISEVFGGKLCWICYTQTICSLPNPDGSVNCTSQVVCYSYTCRS